MIPKKRTEEDIRASFELILKDHNHISNLTKLEARDFYQLAAKEYKSIIKHSDKIEGYDLLKRSVEILGMEGPPLDKIIEDKSREMNIKIMEDNRCGFVLHFSSGTYLSGLNEIMRYCEKYNIPIHFNQGNTEKQIFDIIHNLEDVISLLDMRWRMPLVKQKERKPKERKIKTLKEACLGERQYEAAKAWLISKNLCDPVTMAWKERRSGKKSTLILRINDLVSRGYAKPLTHEEIIAIAKNTFKVKMGIDIVKRPSVTDDKDRIPYFQG